MRLLFITLLFPAYFFAIGQPGNGNALATEELKPFGTPYGTINYKVIEGGEGSVELKFDLYGMFTAGLHQVKFSLYGIDASMKELTIRDGDFQYIYDLDKNRGRVKSNKTQSDLLRYKSPKETREAMFSVNNGKMVGMETILDKPVEHWLFESGQLQEAWIWEGILLKAKVKKPKVTYTYEATSIDLNKPEIRYPEGISISQD